jgi:hypothetical protein
VRLTGRAAIVVDDVSSRGHSRVVEVRGTAEIVQADGNASGADSENAVIRIHPRHILSVGIEPSAQHMTARSVARD